MLFQIIRKRCIKNASAIVPVSVHEEIVNSARIFLFNFAVALQEHLYVVDNPINRLYNRAKTILIITEPTGLILSKLIKP